MKKKLIALLLTLAMVSTIVGGCGSKEVEPTKSVSGEVAKDVSKAVKESTDAATEKIETVVEEPVNEDEPHVENPIVLPGDESYGTSDADSTDEDDFFYASGETTDDGFFYMSTYAASQDKSSENPDKSESSYDVAIYLDADGYVPMEWYNYDEYTGKFVYPTFKKDAAFSKVSCSSLTDTYAMYSITLSSDPDKAYFVSITPGTNEYTNMESLIGIDTNKEDYSEKVEIMYRAETSDGGECDVIYRYSKRNITTYSNVKNLDYNDDGEAIDADTGELAVGDNEIIETNTYYYKLGDYTISILCYEHTASEDEIQPMIDSIELVGTRNVAE